MNDDGENPALGGISALWDRISTVSPPPNSVVVGVAALIALVLVLEPRLWRLTRNVVTIVHEGGHLLVALLFGRRLQGVRLHSDTSGVAVSSGKPTGLGMIATTFAGYTAPSVLGLGSAWLLGTHHSVAVLWICLIALAAMVLLIRNLFGVLSLAVVAALLFSTAWWGTEQLQVAVAYAGTLFLLFAGPRPVLELQRSRARGAASHSDADQLARLTVLPGIFWVAGFLAVTVGASLLGGWLVLEPLLAA